MQHEEGYLKIATMGNVDSGKSTLAGSILRTCSFVNIKESSSHNIVDSLQFERKNLCTWNIAHGYGDWNDSRFHVLDDPGHLARFDITVSGIMASDLVLYTIDIENFDASLFKFHLLTLSWLNKANVVFVINIRGESSDSLKKNVVQKALSSYRIKSKDIFEMDVLKTFTQKELNMNRNLFLDRMIEKAIEPHSTYEIEEISNTSSVFLWNPKFEKITFFDEQYPSSPSLSFENLNEVIDNLLMEKDSQFCFYSTKMDAFETKSRNGFGLLVLTETSVPIGLVRF